MSWVRLDDAFPSHRKVRRLSDAAFRMHVSALCWSSKYLTDGRISTEDLQMVADLDDHQDPQVFLSVTKELVQRSVWHEADHNCRTCPTADEGWVIHDFLDLNPSSEQVQHQRTLAAERKRRQRERQDGGEPDDDRDGHGDVTRDSRDGHGARHAPVTLPRPLPTPTPTPTPKPRKKTASSATADDPHFDRFWAAYPRKVEKVDARRAWNAAVKKASPEVLIAAAARYAEQKRGTEAKFITQPPGWLNKERWTDEEASPSRVHSNNNNSGSGWAPYLNPVDPKTAYAGYRDDTAELLKDDR